MIICALALSSLEAVHRCQKVRYTLDSMNKAFFCFEAIEHCLPTTRIVLFRLTLVWELVLSGSGGWQTLQLSIKLKN